MAEPDATDVAAGPLEYPLPVPLRQRPGSITCAVGYSATLCNARDLCQLGMPCTLTILSSTARGITSLYVAASSESVPGGYCLPKHTARQSLDGVQHSAMSLREYDDGQLLREDYLSADELDALFGIGGWLSHTEGSGKLKRKLVCCTGTSVQLQCPQGPMSKLRGAFKTFGVLLGSLAVQCIRASGSGRCYTQKQGSWSSSEAL